MVASIPRFLKPVFSLFDLEEMGNDLNAVSIFVQPDGKTVVGGYDTTSDSNPTFDSDFLLLRIPADPHVGVNEQNPGITALTLSPNPLQSQATLSYELTRAETVSILLHDASGKPVWAFVSEEKRPRGTNREELAIPKELPGGVYYLTVQTGKGRRVWRL